MARSNPPWPTFPDLAGTISLVARITRDDPRELLAKCKAARTFCWLARKADAETADRIRSMNLRGIYFQKESKRFSPKRELAAQVLGYVGMDDEGLSGIERADDDELRGKPGRMLISVDARRKWFGSVEKQPDPGENVVLTIDEKIQYIAERELETAMRGDPCRIGHGGGGKPENGRDPRTGQSSHLQSQPGPRHHTAKTERPRRERRVRATIDLQGSHHRESLEEKLTHPSEVFDCQMGSIVINGMRIRDSKPHGLLTVAGILAESSDVGAIKIALRLGEERFYKYIRAFGFGQHTGIELPGETRGLSKPLNRWSKVSIGAISMGQEIGVTPLQLVGMISTIANDGRIMPTSCSGVTPISCPMETAPMDTLDQRFSGLERPRVSPGISNSRVLPETEGADVLVKTLFAQAQRDLDRAHVARFGQNAGHRRHDGTRGLSVQNCACR